MNTKYELQLTDGRILSVDLPEVSEYAERDAVNEVLNAVAQLENSRVYSYRLEFTTPYHHYPFNKYPTCKY